MCMLGKPYVSWESSLTLYIDKNSANLKKKSINENVFMIENS